MVRTLFKHKIFVSSLYVSVTLLVQVQVLVYFYLLMFCYFIFWIDLSWLCVVAVGLGVEKLRILWITTTTTKVSGFLFFFWAFLQTNNQSWPTVSLCVYFFIIILLYESWVREWIWIWIELHTYIQEFNLRTHVMWVYFLSSPMLTVWLPLAVLKASTGYLSLSPFSFLFIYLF